MELEELNVIQDCLEFAGERSLLRHRSLLDIQLGTWNGREQGDTAKFGGSRILSNSGVLSASLARRERDDKSKRARITQLRPKLGI